MNHVVAVKTADGKTTEYKYNAIGKIEETKDPYGNKTTNIFDNAGRVWKVRDPYGLENQFTYDGNGNLIQVVDANGYVKQLVYDSDDRLIKKLLPDNTYDYSYDSVGNMKSAADKNTTIEFQIDAAGRLHQESVTGRSEMSAYPSLVTSYTYDSTGNRTNMADSLGGVQVYGYNSSRRLASIAASGNQNYALNYDNANRLTAISRPGSTSTYQYTAKGLDSVRHYAGSNQVAYVEFGRLADGQIVQKTNRFGQSNYAYDAIGSLASATVPTIYGGNESYQYDDVGNRTADATGSYAYDANHRRLNEDGRFKYFYDNNGNLVLKTSKLVNEVTSYQYTSENQLVKVTVAEVINGPVLKEVTFTYDAVGRRIQKKVIDNTTAGDPAHNYTRKYAYDGMDLRYELNASNVPVARYTYSGSGVDDVLGVVITSAGVSAGLAQEAGTYYLLKDNLGTVTDVVDSNGNIKQSYLYSSYGKQLKIVNAAGADISSTPALKIPFGFTGREFDSETGLYYFRARYLDASTGRFLQEDPSPGNIEIPNSANNKYIFGLNNPIENRDPLGRDAWNEIGKIAAIVVGAVAAFYGGAFVAAYLGLSSYGGLIVGAFVGAFIGGVVTALGYWATGNDPAEGLKIGIAVGAVSGAAGGFYSADLVSVNPYQFQKSQIYGWFKSGVKSLFGNGEAGAKAVDAAFAQWIPQSWPIWETLAVGATKALPFVVAGASVGGIIYAENCIKEGTCGEYLPTEYKGKKKFDW